MAEVDALLAPGSGTRTDTSKMPGVHAADHSATRSLLDALVPAVQADIDGLETNVTTLLADAPTLDIAGRIASANAVAPFPALAAKDAGVYVNPPVSGYLGSPVANMTRWRQSASGPRQVVLIGDSITQGVQGPYDFWWLRMARDLANDMGPLIGYGFRGRWTGEFTTTGAWTRIAPSTAADVAPFAEGWQATGGPTNFNISWNPATGPTGLRFPTSFEIIYVDVPSTQPWSYSIDGGITWTHGPTPLGDNQLKRFQVNTASIGTVTFGAGTTTSAGTAAFVGVIPYYVANGWAADGLIVHNLGRTGCSLSFQTAFGYPFWRSTSGTPVVSNGGSPAGTGWGDILDLLQPDLVTIEFINDYNGATDTSNLSYWEAGHLAVASRISAYVDSFGAPKTDLLFINNYEGSSSGNTAVTSAYRAMTKTAATECGAAVLDFFDAWKAEYGFTDNLTSRALLTPSDHLHPNQYGGIDWGSRIPRALRAIS